MGTTQLSRRGLILGAIATPIAAVLSQAGMASAAPVPVATPVRYHVTTPYGVDVYFSELVGITGEIGATDYIGVIVKTPSFGKTRPPTVTLKGGVDRAGSIWAWHTRVLQGNPSARVTTTIQMLAAGGLTLQTLVLQNAWPTAVAISAGSGGALYESVTFTGDSLTLG